MEACPNCAFTPRRRRGRWLGFIAAGSTLITSCACYGIPATCAGTKLPDGGLIGGSPSLPLCLDCTTIPDASTNPECGATPDGGTDGGTDGGP
ncbi:MAG: hypothetical protein QM723_35220 [Myxococcaceae bacterium]